MPQWRIKWGGTDDIIPLCLESWLWRLMHKTELLPLVWLVYRGQYLEELFLYLVYFIHNILSKVRWKWNWNGKINASSVCIPMAAFAVLGRPRLVLIKLTFGWVENTYQYFSIVFQYEHWHKNIENSIQFSWDWKYGAGLSTEICRKSTISVQCNLGKENWKKFKIHFHAIL